MDGETLKQARAALGLTQEQLAEALGLPRVTITRWETGTVAIRHGRLVALALEALHKRKRKGGRRGR